MNKRLSDLGGMLKTLRPKTTNTDYHSLITCH